MDSSLLSVLLARHFTGESLSPSDRETLINVISDCDEGIPLLDRHLPWQWKEKIGEKLLEVNERLNDEFLRSKEIRNLTEDLQSLLNLLQQLDLEHSSLFRSLRRLNQILLDDHRRGEIPAGLIDEVTNLPLRSFVIDCRNTKSPLVRMETERVSSFVPRSMSAVR